MARWCRTAALLLMLQCPALTWGDELDELFGYEPASASEGSEQSGEEASASADDDAQGRPAESEGEGDNGKDPAEAVITLEESPPPALKPPPRGRVVEEIIVTATKREQSARDLAASVQALTGEAIESTGLQDLDDIIDAMPGVNISNQAGQNAESQRVTIRGIAAGINQNDTAGIFIDETPFTDVFFPLVSADANPYDMQTVEVLKGPVGTLFGGSALNGAIRYIPNKPDFSAMAARGFFEIAQSRESEDLSRTRGGVFNLPLGETAGLRLVGIERSRAGLYDSINQTNPGRDVDSGGQNSYRALAAWQPLETLELSAMLLDQESWADDNGYAIAGNGGQFLRSQGPLNSPSLSAYQSWQLKADWDLGFADLVLVGSRSDKRYDAFSEVSHNTTGDPDPATSSLAAIVRSVARPRTLEARLVSDQDGDWDYLIGLFDYDFRTDAIINLVSGASVLNGPVNIGFLGELGLANATPEGAGVLVQSLLADVGERAAFGELNWRFRPDWQATLGLRVYRFRYNGEFLSEGPACVLADPTCPTNGGTSRVVLDTTETGYNPKLSLKWDLSDELMSYFTAARGFRFGGLNLNSHPEIPPNYSSDSLWSYEIGLRSQWLDRSLTADFAVFAIDWRDAPLEQFTSDGLLAYTDNIGRVAGQGVEFQFIWLPPLDGLRLDLSGAYADIRTAEDYTSNSGVTTPKGSPWPRAPHWQTTAAIGWDGELAGFALQATLSHNFFDEMIQGFSAVDNRKVFNYSEYALNLQLSHEAWRWFPRLSLNVGNLSNTQAEIFGRDVNPPQSVRRYNNPRHWSLRMAYEF